MLLTEHTVLAFLLYFTIDGNQLFILENGDPVLLLTTFRQDYLIIK